MKTIEPIETTPAVTTPSDAERHAARVVLLSTLLFFIFIFVLQAIAP
jgi:hypothetical protein